MSLRARRMDLSASCVVLIVGALVLAGCGERSSTARSQGTAHSRATAQAPTTAPREAEKHKRSVPGGHSSHTAGATALTRAEASCLKLNAEIVTEQVQSSSNREIAHFAPKNKVLEERVLKELRALKPPIKPVRAWARILALREELARELGELGTTARRNDSRGVHELVALKRSTRAKLSRAATQAGLKQCAHVG